MPETRLVARLKAVTAVTDLVATRIWPHYRESDTLPAITYELAGDTPVNSAGGATTTSQARLTVSCFASTYAGVKALASAVRTALSGWTDSSGNIWHIDNIQDLPPEQEPGENAMYVYEIDLDLQVWYSTA